MTSCKRAQITRWWILLPHCYSCTICLTTPEENNLQGREYQQISKCSASLLLNICKRKITFDYPALTDSPPPFSIHWCFRVLFIIAALWYKSAAFKRLVIHSSIEYNEITISRGIISNTNKYHEKNKCLTAQYLYFEVLKITKWALLSSKNIETGPHFIRQKENSKDQSGKGMLEMLEVWRIEAAIVNFTWPIYFYVQSYFHFLLISPPLSGLLAARRLTVSQCNYLPNEYPMSSQRHNA